MPQITPRALRAILGRFPWDEWSSRLAPEMTQTTADVLQRSARRAAGDAWRADSPFLSRFATFYVGERIKQLDATTKAEVSDLVRSILAQDLGGMNATQIASLIGDKVREKYQTYEGYRALRIARTETAIAENNGEILGYSQAGVEEVDVLDGSDDPICAEASGARWTLTEALSDPIGHPNCTRTWTAVVPDKQARRRNLTRHARRNWAIEGIRAAVASHRIWQRDDPHARPLAADDDEGTSE